MEKVKNFIKIAVLFFIVFYSASDKDAYAGNKQKPAVAGLFYPKDKSTLKAMVDEYLNKAEPEKIDGDIFAIIAPHAGYIYSGKVAGYAFKAIRNKPYKTAIIVAPSHRHGFKGLAVLDKDSYITPLGEVPIDKQITKQLLEFNKDINYYIQPFLKEHAAEVEIPFLQESLKDFKIVVILTGIPSYDNCILLRDALTSILKGRKDILVVVSTDMSHYHHQTQACLMDEATLSIMQEFDPEALFDRLSSGKSELCGGGGVVGVMMAARNLGADSIKVLKYATSADASGDKDQVVGYCAAVIYNSKIDTSCLTAAKTQKRENEEKDMGDLLNQKQKERLLQIARETLETYIAKREIPEFKEGDPVLNKKMGAFVTLHKHGQLRGCIGNMIGQQPLYLTVRDMAIQSSTQDPRFPPVRADELEDIDIEISVLSPMERIDDPDKIVMGKHGVMVQSGFRSGVYLPQVAAETGWGKKEFMDSLCLNKAGLPAESWKTGACDIYIFSAEVFGEEERSKEN